MTKPIYIVSLFVFLFALSGLCQETKENQPTYLVGFPPFFSPQEMQKQFTPLLEYLSQQTGVTFQLTIAEDYDQMLDWLQEGHVSFAYLSSYAYVKASERSRIVLLATVISEGSSSIRGIIIARTTSRISELKDLKGRSFAYVDTKSTSGFISPRAMMIKNGYTPSQFLGRTGFCGNHFGVIESVLSGQYDAGATYEGALNIAQRKGYKVDKLKIVGEAYSLPHDAFVAMKSVDSSLCERVQKALLQLNRQSEPAAKILSQIGWIEGWETGQDEKYRPLRDLIQYGRERPRFALSPIAVNGEKMDSTEVQKVSELFMSTITQSQRFFIVPMGEHTGEFTPRELVSLKQDKNLNFVGELILVKKQNNLSLSLRFYECKEGTLQKVYMAEGKLSEIKKIILHIIQNLASDHPLNGIVVESKKDRFIIDLGRLHGVHLDDIVEVYTLGEEIRHPITDAVIGRIEKVLAKGKVVEVSFDSSICSSEEDTKLFAGNSVRLYARPQNMEFAIPSAETGKEEKTGVLKILTVPAGAHIWLDGKNTGMTTPYTFARMTAKNYVVRVDLLYHRSEQQVVAVHPDDETMVSITLAAFHETEFGLWLVGLICTSILVISVVGLRLLDWRVKSQQAQFKISPQKLGILLDKLPYPLAKGLFQYKKGKLSIQDMTSEIDQFLTSIVLSEHGYRWETRIDCEISWEILREQLLREHKESGNPDSFPWTEKVLQFYRSSGNLWRVLATKGISNDEWLLISGWRLIYSLWGKNAPVVGDFLTSKKVPEDVQICRVDALIAQFADFFQEWRFFVAQDKTVQIELKGIQEGKASESGKQMKEGHLFVDWGEKRLDMWPYTVYLSPLALWPVPKFFFLDKILPANGYFNNYISYDRGSREDVVLHISYWKEILPQWIPDAEKRAEVEGQLVKLFETLAQVWKKQ